MSYLPPPQPRDAIFVQEEWVKRAACRNLPPIDKNLFFPDFPGTDNAAAAKAICATCDVTAECLDWALKTNETDGVWGGLSAVERKRMRRPGADVRFAQCQFCKAVFSFVWDERPGYKTPNFCNDVCRHEDRRVKKNESRRRRILGIAQKTGYNNGGGSDAQTSPRLPTTQAEPR